MQFIFTTTIKPPPTKPGPAATPGRKRESDVGSYKLQHALELVKFWRESATKTGNPNTPEATEWMAKQTERTTIIQINGINTFIYDGYVLISNLPENGAHHTDAYAYKVNATRTRPYVKVASRKMYLDELARDGDHKICLNAATKTGERKYFCVGLRTGFSIQ